MRLSRRGRRWMAVALVPVLAAGLAGCVQVTEASSRSALIAPRGELILAFDEGLARPGTPMRRIQNSGSALMRVSIARRAKGKLLRASGRYGYAIRTPSYTRKEPAPAAVLVIRPRGDDRLSPGTQAFRWGADVRLQPRALRKTEGSNVLQRGLYADPVQFKLQVDNGVPSCRVRGAAGAVKVEAPRALEPREWYRLHCLLRNGRLTLRVGEAGRPGASLHSAPAAVGALDFRRSTPVAVGGKVNHAGEIITASAEQFHGLLDNVFVDIG